MSAPLEPLRRPVLRSLAISAALLMILVSFTVPSSRAAAETVDASLAATSSDGTAEGLRMKVVSDGGSLTTTDQLAVDLDRLNRSAKIRLADSGSSPFWILISESSLRNLIPYPAFGNVTFSMRTFESTTWFGVRFQAPVELTSFSIRDFRPETGRARYTYGSPASIALERPMFISLAEVPRVEWATVTRSNPNGTWTESVPVLHPRLGMNFTDVDSLGQTVAVNRTWLGNYALRQPVFQHADGSPVANTSDAHYFYLRPDHFSILYAFTTNEEFTKDQSDQTYSNVFWDSANRNIYVLADRRDPAGTNERLSSPAPVVYDQTSSFTLRATWKIAQKGHWQLAVPVFFMASGNTRVDMANSVYVIYASRDQSPSDPRYNPFFYLRYRDSTGTMRVNYVPEVTYQTQYEFLLRYDAYARTLTFAVYDAMGAILASTTYGLGPSGTFSLGKVGAGAWGSGGTSEPTTIATTDNMYFDANMARNGNFEVDSNSDGIPDNWQQWTGGGAGAGTRSSTRVKFGSYAHQIADSSGTQSYGLQTVRMSASPDKAYVASTWVYVESGRFDLYLEFYNALSGGTRLAVGVKSSATTGQWEYLDLTMIAPTGAVALDLLVYSSTANTGTGYFDGAELRLRRSTWAISTHDGEPGLPAGLPGWQIVFDRAAELGASHVRTDLRWNEFKPTRHGPWDASEISYWRSVIQMGKTRGIDLVAILNGPPPGWITTSELLTKFNEFCKTIGQEFSSEIYFYQILNEPNWNPEVGSPGDFPSLARECEGGLLWGEGVFPSDSWYSAKSKFKTIVNALANWGDWKAALRGWLDAAGDAIYIAAIDHYPGTKTLDGCPPSDPDVWDELDNPNGDDLFQILKDYGKEGAIMETGFSSWSDLVSHGQDDQETWVNCNLPFIRDKIKTHNLNNPKNFFLIATWYELVDHGTDSGGGELDHYGLLETGDLVEKLAYNDFRARVAEYTW